MQCGPAHFREHRVEGRDLTHESGKPPLITGTAQHSSHPCFHTADSLPNPSHQEAGPSTAAHAGADVRP